MKKVRSIVLITLIIFVYFILTNRDVYKDFEWGKYENLQEAIAKGIPHEVNNIVHTEKYDNVTIIMYTTAPDKEAFPAADFEPLAVAFFKGNDDEGWEDIGQNGWTHYENENMTLYSEPLREFDKQGNTIHEFYVVFGEINNANIVTVETKTEDEETFEEAQIISKEGNRYYFQIGREMIVRGLSESGEVIDRQGG